MIPKNLQQRISNGMIKDYKWSCETFNWSTIEFVKKVVKGRVYYIQRLVFHGLILEYE